MTIPDDMIDPSIGSTGSTSAHHAHHAPGAAREPTDAELAANFRKMATAIRAGRPIILADPDDFDIAAQRLEARSEISEAMVERAAKAIRTFQSQSTAT